MVLTRAILDDGTFKVPRSYRARYTLWVFRASGRFRREIHLPSGTHRRHNDPEYQGPLLPALIPSIEIAVAAAVIGGQEIYIDDVLILRRAVVVILITRDVVEGAVNEFDVWHCGKRKR